MSAQFKRLRDRLPNYDIPKIHLYIRVVIALQCKWRAPLRRCPRLSIHRYCTEHFVSEVILPFSLVAMAVPDPASANDQLTKLKQLLSTRSLIMFHPSQSGDPRSRSRSRNTPNPASDEILHPTIVLKFNSNFDFTTSLLRFLRFLRTRELVFAYRLF